VGKAQPIRRWGLRDSFDLKTLRPAASTSRPEDADGVVSIPPAGHVFVVNGTPDALTAIDPATIARLPL